MDGAAESEADNRPARIVAMRDGGASWHDIEQAFGLTRQQARYAFQIGKRAERRAERRSGQTS
jgi:type V secretory pathway adhesin AidA